MTWPTVPLKRLCVDAGQYGLNVSPGDYTDEGIRLVRTTDIAPNGTLSPASDGAVFVGTVEDPRFLAQTGDILLARSGSVGRAVLVEDATPVSFAGYLVRFRPRHGVSPKFLKYCVDSQPFQDAVRADAVSSTIDNFNAARYATIEVPAPPQQVQEDTVRWVDGEVEQMDMVRAELKRIRRLLHQRQVAVRSARMSEAWPRVRLRHVAQMLGGWAFPSTGFVSAGDGVRLVRGVNVKPGKVDWADRVDWPTADPTLADYELAEGDVLVGLNRPIVGGGTRVAQVAADDLPAYLLQRVARIRPRKDVIADWLYLALSTPTFQDHLTPSLIGATFPYVAPEQVMDFLIPLPPVEVQEAVVAALRRDAFDIESALAALDAQEALLEERHRILVAEAVTGRLKVGSAA